MIELIDGVELLAVENTAMSLLGAIFVCASVAFLGFCIGYMIFDKEPMFGIVLAVIITIVTFLFIYILPMRKDNNVYSVTVSDEVSWVDFNDHYEIVSQDGKIIKIKEKKFYEEKSN